MAFALRRVLSRAGYEIAIATDGSRVGTLLQTFRPSLLTLDLRMPDLDGLGVLDFLQRLGKRGPTCRVLVVSAESPFRIAKALSLGAHGALVKPFSNDALLHEVSRLLAAPVE